MLRANAKLIEDKGVMAVVNACGQGGRGGRIPNGRGETGLELPEAPKLGGVLRLR